MFYLKIEENFVILETPQHSIIVHSNSLFNEKKEKKKLNNQKKKNIENVLSHSGISWQRTATYCFHSFV